MRLVPNIIRVASATSTNRLLAAMADAGHLPAGTVIVAERQTEGRGQGTNSWESAAGKNLTLSVLFYPTTVAGSKQFILSMAVSMAVWDFVASYLPDISVKWPNDIYAGDCKIAGILIEHRLNARCIRQTIAGIGLNINQERFVSDAPNPVSLAQATGRQYDMEECLEQLLLRLFVRYEQALSPEREQLRDDYLCHLYRMGQWHTYKTPDGRVFEACITGVDEYGRLELCTVDDERLSFGFKEVGFA